MFNPINFIPFILYMLWLGYNIYKVGRLVSMSSFIISIFAFSMFSFGVCSILQGDYYFSLQGLLLITLPLLLLVWPLTKFESRLSSDTRFYCVNTRRNTIVTIFIIIIGLYALIFFSRNLYQVFSSDLTTLRNLILEEGGFYKSNIFSKVAVFGAYLSPIGLLLFFYSCIDGRSKKISALLFVSSLSFIVYTLNVAGRDGFVIWAFTYMALLGLFSPLLSKRIKKIQVYSIVSVFALVAPVFLYISAQRFSADGGMDTKVLSSLFDYLGQQLYMLSSRIDKLSVSSYPGNPKIIIPVIHDLWSNIWGTTSAGGNRYDLRIDSLAAGLDTFRFAYFAGDFITELGLLGIVLFTLVASTLFHINLKIVKNRISLPRLVIVFSWYMTIIVGVFYFYYGQVVGNVFLLFPFLLYLFYKIKIPGSDSPGFVSLIEYKQ